MRKLAQLPFEYVESARVITRATTGKPALIQFDNPAMRVSPESPKNGAESVGLMISGEFKRANGWRGSDSSGGV